LLRGQKQQARDTIKRLLAEAPNEPRVHNVAADIARWDGQYDKALREYARWLRLSPREEVKVHTGRARIYSYKRRYDQAVSEYEKALALEPDHAFVRCFYALTKHYLGKTDEAIDILTRVLGENPQMQFPRIFLAKFYLTKGENERASALITPAVVAAAEADGDIAYWLAGYYSLQNDNEESLKWFRRAIDMGNENYPWFQNDPTTNNVRSDPRYQEIMDDLRERWERLTGARSSELPASQPQPADRV
jgi:Tfp pilus assembly protein PilF